MELKQCVPSEMNPPLAPVLVTDEAGLQQVASFLAETAEFVLDIETNVTPSFFDRRVRTIQVGNKQQQFVIDLLAFAGSPEMMLEGQGHYTPNACFQPVIRTLRPYLETDSKLKIGHNLSFEYEQLRWCLGFRSFHFYDTLLAEKVIYAGAVHFMQPGFWGLDDLVRRYCRLEISKDAQKSFDLCTPLTEAQVEYGALDVRLPAAVKQGQSLQIARGKLERAVQIENDAIPAFGDMHLNGLLIDIEAWTKEIDKVKEKHIQFLEKLDELFIPIVGKKGDPVSDERLAFLEADWRNTKDKEARAEYRKTFQQAKSSVTKYRQKSKKFEGNASIQYGSPAQLLAALRQAGYTEKKLKSTNDEHLERLEGEPLIDAIRDFRETEKLLTTYGPLFLEKYIDKRTGRVHSRIDQLGAATGRTTSSKPNVQNIPRGSNWRSCFIARPGYKVITVDYNGCELRILAEASGEKVWIDAFNKGWDVHSVCAEILYGDRWKKAAEEGCAYYTKHDKCKCKEHKKLRDYVKAVNFGIAYGMEAGKLSRKLRITKDEAQELLTLYRKTFAAVTKYLQESGKDAQLNLCSRTLSGRWRLYTKPDYEKAKQMVAERFAGRPFDPREVTKQYSMMYGNIEREGKNSPIQGTNADMVKVAIGAGAGYLWRELETKYGAFLVNMVHDEIVVECPEAVAEDCLHFIGDCMKRAGAEFLKSVVAEYAGEISECWSKG